MSGVLGILLGDNGAAGGAAYVGPGDISTALAWFGFRAYSFAAIGGNVCDIKRASDSSTSTFVSLATGALDTASIATFLAATTGIVTKLYDQTGNGKDMVSTANVKYQLDAPGSLPAMTVSTNALLVPPAATIVQALPLTIHYTAKRTGAAGNNDVFDSQGAGLQGGPGSSLNQVFIYNGGAVVTASATDGSWHSVINTFNNASSEIMVDGTGTAVNTASAAGMSSVFGLFGNSNDFTAGSVTECGVWAGAMSGPNKTSLDSNVRTFWGI